MQANYELLIKFQLEADSSSDINTVTLDAMASETTKDKHTVRKDKFKLLLQNHITSFLRKVI